MAKIKELDLVGWIRALFPGGAKGLALGIGDDCAAIRPTPGHEILVTTDTMVEGIHFYRKYAGPAAIGAKTASVNLSDIAAMGGRPRFIFLSVNVTPDIEKKWMVAFLKGFKKAIAPFGCVLAGGNVTSTKNDLSFTVTAIGEVERGKRVDRSGAKPGDAVFVTGTPGDSALGLGLMLEERKKHTAAERRLIARNTSPTPRIEWGVELASNRISSAMIDVSDGVALDLYRIAEASNVSAQVALAGFPLSKDARTEVEKRGASVWREVLSGGEDYELLFTVPKRKLPLVNRMIKAGDIAAAPIGKIVRGRPGIHVTGPDGKPLRLKKLGWLHG